MTKTQTKKCCGHCPELAREIATLILQAGAQHGVTGPS